MFAKIKDKTVSTAINMALNNYIKDYGEMLKFNLDSKHKSISMELMLEGEKESLTVNIDKYDLIKKENKYFLKIYTLNTSRKWINTIASTYLEGKEFEIPSNYAKMLEVII
jgi:hypothetical protein